MQTITIDKKQYVLVPKEEYVRIAAIASMPQLPEPNERGNYPAAEYARALIARQLITRRRAANLSQRELAEKAGVRFESVSRIETGKVSPKVATLDKIDRVLSLIEKKKERKR